MIGLVCGYLGRSGAPVSFETTKRMAAGLALGRPFAQCVWSGDGIALARVSLGSGTTVPAKPAVRHDGPYSIAADLRLPDFPDDAVAHDAVSHALAAEDFPAALDGDFALAVWDAARGALTLTRDRLGIRPLFYAQTPTGDLAFASFPEALIEGGGVEGRLRTQAMATMALGGAPAGEETWIEGVRRVPPGHALTVRADGARLRCYWRYPVKQRVAPSEDRAVAARTLRSALESAVDRTLPEHTPVFTLLSGGLDSGAVTALAGRLGRFKPTDVNACCLSMPASHRDVGALDETPTARQVADQAGVELLEFPVNPVRDGLLGPLSATFVDPADPDYAYDRLLAHAAERGADRVLCGFGGDDAASFNGRGALLADFLALRWGAFRRTAREMSTPAWRSLLSQAAAAFLPPALERHLRRAAGHGAAHVPLRERAVQPRYRPAAGWRPELAVGPARLQRRQLEAGALVHRLELQAWHAARHGVRFVFPLLDWRLLETVAALPARLQIHGGLRRALFRSAVADLLPQEILNRSEKLNPAPATLYQLALDRDALIAEARRVAQSPAASAVIDLGEIERQLASLPEPEAVADAIRAKAAEGLQLRDPRTVLLQPFMVARALAQNDPAWRAKETSLSETAQGGGPG